MILGTLAPFLLHTFRLTCFFFDNLQNKFPQKKIFMKMSKEFTFDYYWALKGPPPVSPPILGAISITL